MTYKGLPSSYNKDLQEDKEPLFDAVDTLSGSLQILTGLLRTMTVSKRMSLQVVAYDNRSGSGIFKIFPDKMLRGLSTDMLATDLAEYLVRKGIPFREAHFICGAAVKMATDKGLSLHELSIDDLQTLHSSFGSDVLEVWSFENSIESRATAGGTSKSSVRLQIDKLKLLLLGDKFL